MSQMWLSMFDPDHDVDPHIAARNDPIAKKQKNEHIK